MPARAATKPRVKIGTLAERPANPQIDGMLYIAPEGVFGWDEAGGVWYGSANQGGVVEWKSVMSYGAVGNGIADDTVALQTADTAAATNGGYCYLPAGTYRIDGTIIAVARWKFDPDAIVIVDDGDVGILQLSGGYEASPSQCFGDELIVRIKYGTAPFICPEHFGGSILTNPRTGTNDSTVAIQRMFESIQGALYNIANSFTPGEYNSQWIRLLGIYGISDQIQVNVGGCRIEGAGPGLTGAGFKWIGPDVVGNASKAMLRLYGCQFALIEGLQFLGLPTVTDANRLYAAIAMQSFGTVPAPFNQEWARGTEIRRCLFGDGTGYFTQPGGYQFQHGIISDGDDGNNDFHTIDNIMFYGCEYDITLTGAQNVYWNILNTRHIAPKTACLWHVSGGEIYVRNFYFTAMPAGSTVVKVGDPAEVAAPDSRINWQSVGGELNSGFDGFVRNSYVSWDTTLQWSFNRFEASLHGEEFVVGTQCMYRFSFVDSSIIESKFTISTEATGIRCILALRECRSLNSMTVTNTTTLGSIDVTVENCWGQNFTVYPKTASDAGRYVGPMNYRKRFLGTTPATLLDAADLYATTELWANRVDIGDPCFGVLSRLQNETRIVTSANQFTMTAVSLFPAGSQIFGCPSYNIDSNYLANSNNGFSRIFIGDASSFRRYGTIVGQNVKQVMDITSDWASFFTVAARDLVLSGGYEIPGATWTWNGFNISVSGGANLNAGMVGNKILITTGAGTGLEANVTAFVDGNNLTLDVSQGAPVVGEAVMFVPFAANKRVCVAPVYLQLFQNSASLLAQADSTLLYAKPLVVV
jgi:hypothetical protein